MTRTWGCVVGLLALFASGFPQAGELLSSQSRQTLLTDYLTVALGEQFPDVSSGRVAGRLVKRDNDTPTNVFVALGHESPIEGVRLKQIDGSIQEVLADLASHSPDFRYRYYDENGADEMFNSLDREGTQTFLADSLVIFVGTTQDIDQYVGRMQTSGMDVTPALDLAKSVAAKGSLALCFNTGFFKPGGSNEIGSSIIFVEWTATSDRVRPCLDQTMMGAFGLRGRLPNGSGSIFADDDAGRPLPLDWDLWRIHLSPELHHGMDAAVARAAVETILDRMQ